MFNEEITALRGFINHARSTGYLVVAVQTQIELDAALDETVDIPKPAAMSEQVGISVTRLASGRYEARVNSDVPPGVTVERRGTPSPQSES